LKKYIFIFARGGSKSVPRKNIKELCGKPLIYYSIRLAQKLNNIEKIYVSTDDSDISRISENFGADIIKRPYNLASDSSPEFSSWKHGVEYIGNNCSDSDIFISLPTTAPLRNIEDVNKCIGALNQNTDFVIGITKSNHSPYFNMVSKNKFGYLSLLNGNNESIRRRQDAPPIFNITTVAYVTRIGYIRKYDNIFEGKLKGVAIPEDRSIDIDSELDFEIAKFLMEKKIKLEC
jgi:N,N'-diacetyl-8-epilegionaminate cytidylyltransferase